ncbi:MAG: hypothetical protein Q8P68_04715 [Candidatus Peregrinibacteria bacterium]|nr:hypothetical protein [Candidatus Peregrinibacteria bacterium]MDZ4244657.1 hypothetical protein [Candidatus Gracilibacteria bacterium]
MAKIITTTQAQKKMCEIAKDIEVTTYIVTNRGEGRMVILPYFDGCMGWVEDYLEDFEMRMNKEALKKELQESLKSGLSDLVI